MRAISTNVIPAKAGIHDRVILPNAPSARHAASAPKEPCVYILASKRDGILYIGVTSEIFERVVLHTLVYVEFHDTMASAIQREKRMKKWNRAWKVRRINEVNPQWIDLWQASGEILSHGPGGRSPPDLAEVKIR